jgi:Right handed beta helix region
MPKEQMMSTSRRAHQSRASYALVAILALALLGAMASIAMGRGPLTAFLSKARDVAHARRGHSGPRIRIEGATKVSTNRTRPSGGDTTPPDTSISSGPSATTAANAASFSFVSSESGSSFSCKLDGGRWSRCKPPRAYTGLADGAHQFAVRASDSAGNVDPTPATWSWSIEEEAPPVVSPPADTTPPDTTISSGPSGSTTATTASFSFSATEAGSSFECKLDSGSWASCSSPKALSGLTIGAHVFSVRAKDDAGNIDPTPASRSWTVEAEAAPPAEEESLPVDTTPPDTTISSGPSGSTTATTASFSFVSNEAGSSFECKLDGGSWSGCSSPKALSALAIASHVFSVRAKDAAGNVDPTPASRSWTVEAEPQPEPEPEPGPSPEPEQTCTTTVSSVSAAQSSVTSAAPGAVVCLADGSYGKVSLDATKAKPGVTLRAAHPGKATIAGASLQGENLTLARFVDTQGVTIQPGADGMTVEHNRITGGGEGIDGCPSSTTTCNDMKIIGNQLIGPFGEDGIHLNRYHDGDGDGIGVLIEGNEISGVRENGSHSDCLQTVWVGDHIVFRRNYLHDNRCQGFFIKDQASLGGVSGPIHGVTVEDNLFLRNEEPCGAPLTSCGQPMYFQVFGPYDGFKMKRNTIWGDDVNSIAAFREGTGSDTVISNNVIYRLWTDTNMSGISLSENTLCMREGNWPSSGPGETMTCNPSFVNPAADDYRLSGGGNRGVDWAPAEVHYGP